MEVFIRASHPMKIQRAMQGSREYTKMPTIMWTSVWRAKCTILPRQGKDIEVFLWTTEIGEAQKWHLKWTSVWRAKCTIFLRQGKDI